jgi:signal transduction histidine kinase/CheY-like chemotaxis protein
MSADKDGAFVRLDLPWYVTYPVAVAVTGGAVLAELAMRPAVYAVPYVVFFLAVAVASLLGGIGPGIVAIALSAVAAQLLFFPRSVGPWPPIMFVVVSGVITSLTGTLRRRYREREQLLREAREAEQQRLAALSRAQLAQKEAEEASRAKDEFLALLGHELRNPLAPIVTALELVKRRGGGEAREIQVIERQVRHLTRLVDDLLDVSRITRGKVELSREPLDVAGVVARAIEMATPLIESKRHRLHTDVAPGLSLFADPHRLAQALGNILVNAAKYTDPSGDVWVSARRDGGDVVLSVRDSGAGMTADLLEHLFDPFVQGPRTRDRAAGGLGIGLSLARNLVRMHGGDVTARSDGPGKGSELVVRLPAEPAAVEPAEEASEAPRTPDSRRVLAVDDNEDAVRLTADLLSAQGHEVRMALDGPSALEAASAWAPDVVILDIGLPIMDGWEVASRLRERFGDAVTLIALTGYGQPSDRARSVEAGFDAHLVKPITPAELLKAVARAPASHRPRVAVEGARPVSGAGRLA